MHIRSVPLHLICACIVRLSHFYNNCITEVFCVNCTKAEDAHILLYMHHKITADAHLKPIFSPSSARLSVVEAWEGVVPPRVLIKLVRAVVFGRTILVFVFPKSLLSFWFYDPALNCVLAPPQWSFQTLWDRSVSVGALLLLPLYHLFVTFDENFMDLFWHFFGFAWSQIGFVEN